MEAPRGDSEGGAGAASVLRCAGDHPLQGLDLSLDLLGVLLAHHVLLVEAAIVHAVGVVEEMLGLVVLRQQDVSDRSSGGGLAPWLPRSEALGGAARDERHTSS